MSTRKTSAFPTATALATGDLIGFLPAALTNLNKITASNFLATCGLASTAALQLPVGTTGQQPPNAAGLLRWNSTTSRMELNIGSNWKNFVRLDGDTMSGTLTLVTPVLGIPTSGTLTNCTGLPAAGVLGTAAILGANTFTALQTITQASANVGILASTGYSLTGSDATSMVNLAGTWNTSGTPTAFKINITDTASAAASLLMDLQVGSASQWKVTKAGAVTQLGSLSLVDSGTTIYRSAANQFGLQLASTPSYNFNAAQFRFLSGIGIGWSSSATDAVANAADTILVRDGAANTLALRNAANAQGWRVYNSWTDGSNGEWATFNFASNIFHIGATKNGTGTARVLQIDYGGTTTAAITIPAASGTIVVAGTITTPLDIGIGNGRSYYLGTTRSSITSPSDGVIGIYNLAGSDFGRLQLGGTTNLFPSIKRNAAAIDFRLADDSAYCAIACAGLTSDSHTLNEAANFILGTTTGTKIGTAATQKLGFWNATPVVRQATGYTPTNVSTDRSYDANATTVDELADVLGSLIADLQSYGLLG